MLNRLPLLTLALVIAVLAGGADGCASDPNVEGAKLYIRSGELDQAVESLNTALTENPDNAEALVLRADVMRRQAENETDPAALQGLIDGAVADLDRARTLDPTVGTTERLAAWAFAVNEGNKVLRNPDMEASDAAALLQSSIALMPDSVQGHFGYGLALIQLDRAGEAVAPLERSIEIGPDPTGYFYLGRAHLLNDNSAEAVTAFENGLAAYPENADLQTALLDAYVRTNQTDRAIERYDAALAGMATGGADEALLRYNYGSLLLQAERYDDAQEQLLRSIELAPDNSDAQYNLGATYNNQAKVFDEQASETQDNDEANRLTERRNELLEQALAPLLRARELSAASGDEANACSALFRVYAQLGRTEEAAEANACAGRANN